MGQVYEHTTIHKFSSINPQKKDPETFNKKFGMVAALKAMDSISAVKVLDPRPYWRVLKDKLFDNYA
jgi:hypothetical protein